MAYQAPPKTAALYRLEHDGAVSVLLTEVSVSNGMAWSPDGGTVYYVDSATQSVDAFDYTAPDGLTNRRALIEVPDDTSTPDGLCVDA